VNRERIVIDTNVILSRAITPAGKAAQAFDQAIEKRDLLQSDATYEELAAKLRSPKLQKYIDEDDARALLDDIHNVSVFVPVENSTDACRDAKDNKFLELAVAGDAKLIVSGDQDLTTLKAYQGIPILTPNEYLEYEHTLSTPTPFAPATQRDHRGDGKSLADVSLDQALGQRALAAEAEAQQTSVQALDAKYEVAKANGTLDTPAAQGLLAQRAKAHREYEEGLGRAVPDSTSSGKDLGQAPPAEPLCVPPYGLDGGFPVEVVDPDLMSRPASSRIVALHGIQVAVPGQLAADRADAFLLLQSNQEPQPLLDRLTLGLQPRERLCTLHEPVIDHDVGSHAVGFRKTRCRRLGALGLRRWNPRSRRLTRRSLWSAVPSA